MDAIRISVLKRALHQDIAKAHIGREIQPCEVFRDGQQFITGLNKPDGFCDWAWKDIHGTVLALMTGGSFNKGIFGGWIQKPGTMVSCCTDGFRPVTFLLEKIDTETIMDTTGAKDPAPLPVYGSERWGEFSYSITGLESGKKYKVRLHFAEIFFGADGKRRFHVDINKQRLLADFDIHQSAGGAFRAVVKEADILPDPSGTITVTFIKGGADMPKISAIEVLESTGKAVCRINSGGADAGTFTEDTFFTGGNSFGG